MSRAWSSQSVRSSRLARYSFTRGESWALTPGSVLSLQTQQCRYNAAHRVANCSGYSLLPRGDEGAMKEALATIGPLSVAIDASHRKFHFYKSGTLHSFTDGSGNAGRRVCNRGVGSKHVQKSLLNGVKSAKKLFYFYFAGFVVKLLRYTSYNNTT